MNLAVIILAAGKGTRMKSSLPKVLHPIANKPMVQHIIDKSKALSPQVIHVIFGHGGEQLKATLAENSLNWVEQKEQLGTGHAVQQVVPFLEDGQDVLITVGDVPLIEQDTLARLVATKQQADLALLTVEMDDPTGLGRIVRDGEQVKAIVEHKDASDEQRQIKEINTGIMMMAATDLKRWLANLSNDNAQGEYYLTDVIEMAASEGKTIKACQASAPIEVGGINNRVQLAAAEREFQRKAAERLMLKGVTLADPSRVDIRGNVIVQQDIQVDVNVIFEGEVNLAEGVVIGANCILKNCTIGANTKIEPNSIVEEAEVGQECQIGPYARLRPAAKLLDKAKVGNFVEVKKSTIGEGSKANHFSYVGDAQIGAGVNIGAGVITANYDGVNKFKTVVGDNAFIGTNSTLIAPVTVADNGFVAAGSTISKDVEQDQLAVARGKQRNISGWQRPVKNS
jgi:bifunctional UDP-N-acetylglucosamine pyrophosphorylase/glucosamine-1-phosphate N-acetyltransferase